jgi:hypothetical protein
MKITPKPITVSDKIDQSRDVAGFNKWAQSSRTVGFIMFILGWFTIPVEVLLRRDFGQRWFTTLNFYAGLFLLLLFATLQYITAAFWGWVQNTIAHIATAFNPLYVAPASSPDDAPDSSMVLFLIAYILIGSYHLYKIWWRNRTNTALHSFDDGTSRLERPAGYLMKLVNVLAIPGVFLYSRLLPKRQRKGLAVPKLINDRAAFANTVVEPLVVFLSAGFLFHGMASVWLFISAPALAIHARWRETARLNKILDFRDSVIEAQIMASMKEEADQPTAAHAIMQQAAETIKNNPDVAPHIAGQYPDLMSIIDEMNNSGSHLGNPAP